MILMGRRAEQIPRHSYLSKYSGARTRRWCKKELRRLRRRMERRDPENVPPRLTRGWAD
jgi:hypothetical protein